MTYCMSFITNFDYMMYRFATFKGHPRSKVMKVNRTTTMICCICLMCAKFGDDRTSFNVIFDVCDV